MSEDYIKSWLKWINGGQENSSCDWSSVIENTSTLLNATSFIPSTAIGLAYTKPFRSLLNPHLGKATVSELRVMIDAGKKFQAIGKTVGGVGLGLTALDMANQYNVTGTIKTSTMIDAGISSFLYAGSFVSGPAAPVFWVGSAIYSGVRLFWGDQIDNWIDN